MALPPLLERVIAVTPCMHHRHNQSDQEKTGGGIQRRQIHIT